MAAWVQGDVASAHERLERLRRDNQRPPHGPLNASGIVVDRAGRPVPGARLAYGSTLTSGCAG